jgi:formimidoylglutamate deiminase
MKIFAKRAYLNNGWATDVRLIIHAGEIAEIKTSTQPKPGDVTVDTLLPGLSNLHSHSFQRAMAGMTEFRAKGRESFWTWRELMYRFLDHLTPEQVGAIASMAFMEMQNAGYAAVGEFHYIHHAPGGQAYDNRAELSMQVMRAAGETGIGLTHLPVLYTYGDVGQKPIAGGQLRFGNSVDQFAELVAQCKTSAKTLNSDTYVGIAPHSLRATSPEDLARIVAQTPEGPIHIHIAEQTHEVERVQEVFGARPVEWLMNNAAVDRRWCLIHATHMTDAETNSVAQSGAVVGLCPITEANLGDGIFNGGQFLRAGGAFGIGTDSNVNIALCEELRMLEYSQRLEHRERNVMVLNEGSTGETLYAGAAKGGAQALNRNSGEIAVGKLADLVAIDSNAPTLCALSDSQILDGYLFAANDNVVTDVWSAGRHNVQDGRHVAHDRIVANYRVAMAALIATLG